LRAALERIGAKGDWSILTETKGACVATPLTPKQITALADKHHIYMHHTGFLIFTGASLGLLEHLAASIKDVMENY
jgi:aspartate/tyrosine/aromatic aminotransferase